MTERELMQAASDLARSRGWLVFHAFDSRRSEPGLPDLLCVRDGRLLAIECKSAKGRVTKAQRAWLHALDAVRDATAIILRPGDTYDELADLLR